MKAVYFAWVRERIGVAEEEITPPASVQTVEQLVDWLAARGEGYAAAFANRKSVRAALDKMHVTTQTPIASAREIAFFPPMTGG
jgi:molybdopterin synthase sulfur carrier subunit